jgi:hypothetical protein
MSRSELEFQIGAVTMRCTTEEVSRTLSALLDEMRHVIPFLRPDERELLRYIMRHESGRLAVRDVFPAFARDSEGHKTLRRFRAAQFVRPAETGRWLRDERIEVKPFARLVWDHLGEDQIFAPAAEPPADAEDAVPAAEVPADEVQPDEAPAEVEADEAPAEAAAAEAPAAKAPAAKPAPAAPVDVEQLAAALWEDDDVLDLRDMETQ